MIAAIVCGGILAECVFGKTLHFYLINRNVRNILKKW